ncbi:hypothetical protein [Klebsiella quasipneumoniae]|uniref:hypothetical protein n=1 Tax=Klebsiella quasipneumoniae TaxID=1463165 RepID=UPI000B407793|nr:hypothetical protein [Klebsiella quasipneumoniae]OVV02826.1 hypothetical protein BME05_07420 [Klebsiella quasipneumoniae subsp. quasipneumoniae]
MKERGMIFNAEMVRALLDGRKTQTRRIIKDCTVGRDPISKFIKIGKKFIGCYPEDVPELIRECCPYGVPGDRIWVRETWARYNIDQNIHDIAYRATTPADWPEEGRWRPSIHMPRWASRIVLEITDVRVERLNTISEEDARAEGVAKLRWGFWKHYHPGWTQHQLSARGSFVTLWKSIYGDESWNSNPWVWVIEFKRVEGGAA